MDLLIPAHRVFQPFFLRKAERRFDLRAHIGFADPSVEIGHENDGGNLFQESTVLGFEVRRR